MSLVYYHTCAGARMVRHGIGYQHRCSNSLDSVSDSGISCPETENYVQYNHSPNANQRDARGI